MTTTPIFGVTDWAAAQSAPWLVHNAAMRVHEAVMRASVLDRDLTAPPGTCDDGAAYLVDATATGAWAGKDGLMAIANGTNAASGWLYADIATEGFLLYVEDEATLLQYVSAAWAAFAGGGGSPVGPHQIYIPAGAMKTRTTNGAAAGSTETTTNKIMVDSLDFDQSTQEYAQFSLRMPKSWDEGTVTMAFVWTATATGNVIWGGQGVAISNDDVLDAAFGTAQEVTDAVTAANDLMESAATIAITIGGTPAEGDWVVFQVYRKAADGGDTVAADAKLLGVVVTMTTNAATDA